MENTIMYSMKSKLRLPSCFVEVTDNEMEYLNGGISFWEGLLIGSAIVCGIALLGTLIAVTGGAMGVIIPALAAKLYAIFGIAFSAGALGIIIGAAASRGVLVRMV